jgi:hypothetical protein
MNDLKFQIINELKQRPAYTVSRNGIQHYTRCPFCGDSSNINHAHLSVKINTDTDEPMVYRCLKCNTSGLVTETFLEEIDIVLDSDSRKELKAYTKKSMRNAKLVNLDTEKFFVPLYTKNTENDQKLDYINQRLGTNLTYEDAKEHKIVLNLFDFMKANDILSDTRILSGFSYGTLKNLSTNYVGFLSTNNNCIIFRDITGKQKERYFKAVLNAKNVNPDSFYSIPNKINLLYTHDIHIHMAEGTFDILSIQKNLIQDDSNNYFYAICGYGGISVIKYLIHHGINTGIHLHIYSDNDKSDYQQKKFIRRISYLTEWIDEIRIHRNGYKGEKDYGVPLNKIEDHSIRIK